MGHNEARFRVMGTRAHVLVVGNASLVARAQARLEDLERRWSRFRPTSEISRLNALPGAHVVVSPDTFLLISRALDAWHRTAGVFDPTVLDAVRAAGYDRDFADVAAHAAGLVPRARPAPGCADIACDERVQTVTLPPGVAIDPGGIGKGLAADIVTTELLEAGARGALVNVGGDLRVVGAPPNDATWDIAIADPARADAEILRVGLLDGAVATSSRVARRWTTRAGEMHHLIDPRTGQPARSSLATVTAVASEGWWAEVMAKVTLIAGLGPREANHYGVLVATIDTTGRLVCAPEISQVAA